MARRAEGIGWLINPKHSRPNCLRFFYFLAVLNESIKNDFVHSKFFFFFHGHGQDFLTSKEEKKSKS